MLSRLVLGTSTPVSAIRAPRSRLAIRLRVIPGAAPPSPVRLTLSALLRRARCMEVRGLSDGRRGDVPLKVSPGDPAMAKSWLLRGMGRGNDGGSAIVSSPGGDRTGLPIDGGSPKDDATEGGGTEGYVSSIPRGNVAGPFSEPSEPGVVALVALLSPTSGEKMGGEGNDAEEDGGVTDGLTGAWDGRCICEGGRGIGTRAEWVIDGD